MSRSKSHYATGVTISLQPTKKAASAIFITLTDSFSWHWRHMRFRNNNTQAKHYCNARISFWPSPFDPAQFKLSNLWKKKNARIHTTQKGRLNPKLYETIVSSLHLDVLPIHRVPSFRDHIVECNCHYNQYESTNNHRD